MILNISSKLSYKFDHKLVHREVEKVIRENGLTGKVEMNLVVVEPEVMRKLHKKYMAREEVTDVLSFPLGKDTSYPDGVTRLGDIAICFQVARRQAKEKRLNINQEMVLLVTHGSLHLLGIHHE